MRLKQTPFGLLAALSVLLPGIVGAFVVVRTFFVYWGHDALASLIVALMGVGLAVGLGELLLRKRRALALEAEVKQLPANATEACVDGASPPLRAMLRARIEHAPQPSLGESITPYLVGLMVMLGLLGTLLGLFETLRGAGQALTESSNVDALRSGLSGPMRGLTRSFGCSAAGVSASAMLGLAAVLVRRVEARALLAVHSYSMGPLRVLSPIRRQLSALDRLASEGEALPRAADALALAASQLGMLAERWETAHRAATEAQQKTVLEVVDKLRTELTRAATDAGEALTSGVTPLLEQVVSQTGEATSRHMGATLEALDRDLNARREADAHMRAALREELSTMRSWLELDARGKADDTQRRLEAMEQTLQRHAHEQLQRLALEREQASAHVNTLEEAARALTMQLSEDAKARREESSHLLGDLAARLDQAAKDRAQESRDELAAIAALGTRLVEEAQAREAALGARWEAVSEALAKSFEEARSRDAQHIGALRAELTQQNEALSERWSALAESVEQAASAARAEEQNRLTRLDELAQRIGSDLGQLSAAMAEQLGTRIESEREQVERSERAMAALEQGGKALFESLERQELLVQTLLETGGDQLARMGAASQEGAREALSRLVELANEQAERFSQLETQLAQHQGSFAKALADELAAHAGRVGKGLEGTTQLVHEAAAVLKASSSEMGAVAEMFAKSVDRQREAAHAWLESLGELEGAVERAGRGAAADALGDQLASTQEVFARQLQFQRELFEQLRNLRGGSPSTRGDADVSA